MRLHRDVAAGSGGSARAAGAPAGRQYVVAIGIDRYQTWTPLRNAVNDARGAVAAFARLGFEVLPGLVDEEATAFALHDLVIGRLARLSNEDSLVVFFAGHGFTQTTDHQDGSRSQRGFLVPVDAPPSNSLGGSLIEVQSWLRQIAHLPPHHILVFLDACHSGIALSPELRYRGCEPTRDGLDALRTRRSRRVVASAFDNERALDSGPVPGHSLFTGALIQLLGGELKGPTTGNELAVMLQRKVISHPSGRQTPNSGTLALHDNGDLVLQIPGERSVTEPTNTVKPTARGHLVPRPTSPILGAPLVAALERHAAERRRGACVLSVLAGDGQAAWAAWAARHGYLALVVETSSHTQAVDALLQQTPWVRCLPGARARLASTARLPLAAIDASIAARSGASGRWWLDGLGAADSVARVAGWLLAAMAEPLASVPDISTAPLAGTALLGALCELAAPTAVLFAASGSAGESWLEAVIPTAARLADDLRGLAIAVSAPRELLDRGLDRTGSAFSIARQGLITVPLPARATSTRRDPAWLLHVALERDPRTAGAFVLDAMVPVHEKQREVRVDLLARDERLAVNLDDWFHAPDGDGYHSTRVVDVWLQRAGVFVVRFVADDVEARLAQIVNEIACGLAARRAEHRAQEPHVRNVR